MGGWCNTEGSERGGCVEVNEERGGGMSNRKGRVGRGLSTVAKISKGYVCVYVDKKTDSLSISCFSSRCNPAKSTDAFLLVDTINRLQKLVDGLAIMRGAEQFKPRV
jgi:hypothetical protein